MVEPVADLADTETDQAERAGAGRRWLAPVLVAALLVAAGSGSTLLWRTSSAGPLQYLMPTAATLARAETKDGPAEIEVVRQQMMKINQTSLQLLASQQAEIKRLTDQVAGLSGRLDKALQQIVPSPRAIPAA